MLAAVFLSVVLPAQNALPSIDSLIRLLEAREQAIRTFACEIGYAVAVLSDRPGVVDYHRFERTEIAIFERTGRFRFESKGGVVRYDADPKKTAIGPSMCLSVCDGQFRYEMLGDVKYRYGWISRDRPFATQKDPRDFLTLYANRLISRFLKDERASVTGRHEFDGRQPLEVITTPKGDQSHGMWRYRFLIDELRGGVCLRIACEKLGSDQRWTELTFDEFLEVAERVPGIWAASVVRHESFRDRPGQKPLLDRKVRGTIKSWTFNDEYKDDVFRLTFPIGLNVTNTVTGSTFAVSRITDKGLDNLASKLKEANSSEIEEGKSSYILQELSIHRPSYWFETLLPWAMALLLLAIVCVVGLFWHHRRKGSITIIRGG